MVNPYDMCKAMRLGPPSRLGTDSQGMEKLVIWEQFSK
jgi:hypothetical protein